MGYTQLTDEVVDDVCEHIKVGATTLDACALVGCSYKTLENSTTGDEPRRPAWARALACARAECRQYWWAELRAARSPEAVKAAHHALFALDRRFREDKAQLHGGIIVQLIQGGEGQAPELRVVTEADTPVVGRLLPPGEKP